MVFLPVQWRRGDRLARRLQEKVLPPELLVLPLVSSRTRSRMKQHLLLTWSSPVAHNCRLWPPPPPPYYLDYSEAGRERLITSSHSEKSSWGRHVCFRLLPSTNYNGGEILSNIHTYMTRCCCWIISSNYIKQYHSEKSPSVIITADCMFSGLSGVTWTLSLALWAPKTKFHSAARIGLKTEVSETDSSDAGRIKPKQAAVAWGNWEMQIIGMNWELEHLMMSFWKREPRGSGTKCLRAGSIHFKLHINPEKSIRVKLLTIGEERVKWKLLIPKRQHPFSYLCWL